MRCLLGATLVPEGPITRTRDGGEMMKLVRGRRTIAVAGGALTCLAIASVAIASSSQVNPAYDLKKLRGSVTADGSSTVGPYTTAAAELFARAGASGVKVTVGISGTGGGFQRFCKNEIDLADASRPIKASEAEACRENGVGYRRAFTVANDALTVVVNGQNTWAKCLSIDELRKIWDQEPTQGRSTTSPRPSTASRSAVAPTSRHPRTTTSSSRVSRVSGAAWATSATPTTRRTAAG
jgi:phosphate transport system substrate-binding protein